MSCNMQRRAKSSKVLLREIEDLRRRLDEAQQVLHGIQAGEVDALVVSVGGEEKVYTLAGADQPYRVLIEAMSEGALTLAADGTILYANARFAGMVKRPLENVIGCLMHQFVAGENKQRLAGLGEGATKAARTAEVTLVAADNTRTPVQLSVVPLAVDELQVKCVVVTDLTEVLAAREARLHLGLIVESSDDAIVSSSLDGTISSWNAAAERMMGYSAGEAIGKSTAILIPGELSHEEEVLEKRIRRAETALHVETVRLRKDGSRFDVALSISPIRDASGQVAGTTRILRDITERKRMEKQLLELSGRLLEAQDEERRRIARELHDSTTQNLTAIGLNLTVVQNSAKLDELARTCLSESATLIQQTLDEIRSISYLLHPPLLDEMGLLSALRQFAEGFSRRSGIAVDLVVPPHLQRMPRSLETTLFRVVQESLSNILRHSESPTAKVAITLDGPAITLEVVDQGRGIAASSVGKHGILAVRPGVGILGMRERLRHLGGSLELRSSAQGTTVKAVAPLSRRAA